MICAFLTLTILRKSNIRSMLADSLCGLASFTNIVVITLNANQHVQYVDTVAGEQASVSPPVGSIASKKNNLCGWDYISQSTEFTVM